MSTSTKRTITGASKQFVSPSKKQKTIHDDGKKKNGNATALQNNGVLVVRRPELDIGEVKTVDFVSTSLQALFEEDNYDEMAAKVIEEHEKRMISSKKKQENDGKNGNAADVQIMIHEMATDMTDDQADAVDVVANMLCQGNSKETANNQVTDAVKEVVQDVVAKVDGEKENEVEETKPTQKERNSEETTTPPRGPGNDEHGYLYGYSDPEDSDPEENVVAEKVLRCPEWERMYKRLEAVYYDTPGREDIPKNCEGVRFKGAAPTGHTQPWLFGGY